MDQTDILRLQHMRDAATEILTFTAGKVQKDLGSNRMLVLAVLKDLEIIGEAASRISIEAREANTHLPWDDIIGMRNRLIHGYFDVNLDVVWETVRRDIPGLLSTLNRILGT